MKTNQEKPKKDDAHVVSLDEAQSKPEMLRVDASELKTDLREVVRNTVEETLNGLLEGEAEQICNAGHYERNDQREAHRSGKYERKLMTQAGEVTLSVPKLKGASFETQIIERYKRRESSVEESLVEMYLAGVSVRRVEDITEALWGERVSPSSISRLNEQIYERIDEWRERPLSEKYPYVFMDGIWLKRSWGGQIENISVLIAVGVNEEGRREVLAVREGLKESKESWKELLQNLYQRGVREMRLLVSDAGAGLKSALPEVYPATKQQRCVFHFHKNILDKVPRSQRKEVVVRLQAIHAMEDAEQSKLKAKQVVKWLKEHKLRAAVKVLENGIEETLIYHEFPREHHKSLRTNNMLERIMREIRRRTRVVGSFPDGKSALMLVCARLRHIALKSWPEGRAYLDIKRLQEQDLEQQNRLTTSNLES